MTGQELRRPDIRRHTSQRIRALVVRMAHDARSPHVASALSSVDILTALYFSVLKIDPARPIAADRDRFIMSKGHGCMAQFATLAERGFFPIPLLAEYAADGGCMAEHPGYQCVPGVEAGTGSLGHGLPIGAGFALAAKMRGQRHRSFVLISDGECNEGSIWEAAIFAQRYSLDNLIAIVDYNKWSAMERTEKVMEPFVDKWRAFGWSTIEVDGHDQPAMVRVLDTVPFEAGRPSVVIAHTTKGKGVSFMENDLEWHYRPPTAADLQQALIEIAAADRAGSL